MLFDRVVTRYYHVFIYEILVFHVFSHVLHIVLFLTSKDNSMKFQGISSLITSFFVISTACVLPVASADSKENFEQIDAQNFKSKVLDAKGTIVVKFFKVGCPYCEGMIDADKTVASEFKNITFFGIDKAASMTLADEWKAQSVPTYIMFKDGKEVARHDSFLSADRKEVFLADYKKWLS